MHEMSIAESVMSIIDEEVAKNNGKRAVRVLLVIGKLSTIVPESLIFCINANKEGTVFQDAEFAIEEIPGKGYCEECDKEYEVGPHQFFCEVCENVLEVRGGTELLIKELEIE